MSAILNTRKRKLVEDKQGNGGMSVKVARSHWKRQSKSNLVKVAAMTGESPDRLSEMNVEDLVAILTAKNVKKMTAKEIKSLDEAKNASEDDQVQEQGEELEVVLPEAPPEPLHPLKNPESFVRGRDKQGRTILLTQEEPWIAFHEKERFGCTTFEEVRHPTFTQRRPPSMARANAYFQAAPPGHPPSPRDDEASQLALVLRKSQEEAHQAEFEREDVEEKRAAMELRGITVVFAKLSQKEKGLFARGEFVDLRWFHPNLQNVDRQTLPEFRSLFAFTTAIRSLVVLQGIWFPERRVAYERYELKLLQVLQTMGGEVSSHKMRNLYQLDCRMRQSYGETNCEQLTELPQEMVMLLLQADRPLDRPRSRVFSSFSTSSSSSSVKGACFRWNVGECAFSDEGCKFDHKCRECGGPHKAGECVRLKKARLSTDKVPLQCLSVCGVMGVDAMDDRIHTPIEQTICGRKRFCIEHTLTPANTPAHTPAHTCTRNTRTHNARSHTPTHISTDEEAHNRAARQHEINTTQQEHGHHTKVNSCLREGDHTARPNKRHSIKGEMEHQRTAGGLRGKVLDYHQLGPKPSYWPAHLAWEERFGMEMNDELRPTSGMALIDEVVRRGVKASPMTSAAERWEEVLRNYNDKDWVMAGLKSGFRIQYEGPVTHTRFKNHGMTKEARQHVKEDVLRERLLGRLAGPISERGHVLRISPLGAVEKEGGSFRRISDLSFPKQTMGGSVNAHIADASFAYQSFDSLMDMVKVAGDGAMLIRFDVKAAFRQVPVSPLDYWALGLQIHGGIYVDARLTCGLSSSCRIWERLADALQWVMGQKLGLEQIFRYADDFCVVLPPDYRNPAKVRREVDSLWAWLGVAQNKEKAEGPVTRLKLLGIMVDTVLMEISIPLEKVRRIQEMLRRLLNSNECTRHQLQVILGHLNHAARCVQPARLFMRRLLELLRDCPITAHSRHPTARGARADASWWINYLAEWNGVSMILPSRWDSTETLTLYTDATLVMGGAYFEGKWFQCEFPLALRDHPIAVKELYTLVLAVSTWADHMMLKKMALSVYCDNMNSVVAFNNGGTRVPVMNALLRSLHSIAAFNRFAVHVNFVYGKENVLADRLSRGDVQGCRKVAQLWGWNMDYSPTKIKPFRSHYD